MPSSSKPSPSSPSMNTPRAAAKKTMSKRRKDILAYIRHTINAL
ncbi:hypothetical protein ACQX3L_06495 [Corynebacterium diphtheriae]